MYLDQCQVGGVAQKPTTLLTVHCPKLQEYVHQLPGRGKCTHSFHQKATGINKDGTFRSAPLKMYPLIMNTMIASAIASTWKDIFQDLQEDWDTQFLPDNLAHFLAPLDPYFEFTRGADFHTCSAAA